MKLTLERLAEAPSPPAARSPPAPAKKSRWVIEGPLGEGGQSHTFVVTDTTGRLQGRYALKRLKNTNRESRFERELKVSLTLNHPNILKVVDSDLDAAKPYLVSELHERGHLKQDYLSPLGIPARLRLFLQLCEALGHAHGQGVIHRDIKPDNVLIRADGALVLADFGLCYVQSDERLTNTQEVHQNWLCTAPEAEGGRDESVTPASDVYCLGKLLYWMLSGGLLPRENHRTEGYDLARSDPKPAYALVNGLLDRMIVVDPKKRLKAGSEVAAEVQTLIKRIEMNAHEINLNAPQHCTYCGIGAYSVECSPRLWWERDQRQRELNHDEIQRTLKGFGMSNALGRAWLILRCNYCGNIQHFQPEKNWLGQPE